MYLPDESIESSALRQGDVVQDVHILGAINPGALQYAATVQEPDVKATWTVPSKPQFGDVIVLSHSCEIDTVNGVKLTSIILAPLRDVHSATQKEKVEELIQSNIIDLTQPQASYLKYFYLAPNPRFGYKAGAVVDFSKCFSVRKQAYQMLLNRKIAQLTEDMQRSMALKLALYFYRNGVPTAA